MLLLPVPLLVASQAGLPKQTQLPKDAANAAKDAKIFRLPRLMMVPMTTDIQPPPSKEVVAQIDAGFRKGWEESVKDKGNRGYTLIPYDKTLKAMDEQLPPLYTMETLEGRTYKRWNTGRMVFAAKSLGADLVAIPSLSEMTIASDKDRVDCRGYLSVFVMDSPYPVISNGWLGGQWSNTGTKTPYAVAREIAKVDIPRRVFEDYTHTKWPSVK